MDKRKFFLRKIKRICVRLRGGTNKIDQSNYLFFSSKLEGSNHEITSLTIEGCINLLKIGLEGLPKLQNLNIWYKNSQGLHELRRKKILSLEQQLEELTDMVLPNITFDLGKLKHEITRLKLNELLSQARIIKTNVENNSKTIIDLLLETQVQIIGKNDPLIQAQLKGQLNAYLNILENNLSKQELQALLDRKTEFIQLKKQIDKLINFLN
ncbi:hypothetical protein RclHR1_00050056 [Rhizophagus clarus]|uniref:Uncharacterized protein n=1 Tax=Rhizophagus clarus TaxID=94130 RepID=A0A2Z6RJU7_9GLOM|nr:hypothetical protein RclHR1_00050056 [Rhizophagus clarus]GES86227.1 hypothetical protein GLOIN_2v1474482 [Rhizophagus clarus]